MVLGSGSGLGLGLGLGRAVNPNQAALWAYVTAKLVDVISSSDPDTTIFRNQVRGGRGRLRARTRPQVGT